MLLPPDLREWLPADHLVHFLLEVVETMDTGEFRVNHRGTGSRQYPPPMMLSLLVYCYATGRFSSRMIERASREDVAVRYLCAGEHPDHETKLPEEISRRKQRMARIREAVDAIEDREKEKADQERQRRKAKVQERKERRERGEKVTGPEPREVEDKVNPKAQYNFTDPESRIMKTKDGFQQCYNAQAAVEVESMLIVANDPDNQANDKGQLVPMVEKAKANGFEPQEALADTGYYSQRQKMRNKLSTPQGRERYGLRKQTVEPVFGIIKEVMRFRQFLMRGQDEVAGEWNLVCCSYNLKRLFSLLSSRSLQLVAPAGRKTA